MRYAIGERLRIDARFGGGMMGVVLERIPCRGAWQEPSYRFASPTSPTGYVWCPEYLLEGCR